MGNTHAGMTARVLAQPYTPPETAQLRLLWLTCRTVSGRILFNRPHVHAAPRRCPAHCRQVASGSGQHCAHLAAGLPAYDVQPTDLTPELFDSIAAYAATTPPAAAAAAAAGAAAGQSGGGGGLPNVLLPPLVLDASSLDWPAVAAAGVSAGSGSSSSGGSSSGRLDAAAVLVINMCHISPLPATRGLLKGAGEAGGVFTMHDRRSAMTAGVKHRVMRLTRAPSLASLGVADW